jgi:hypothetical protein
VKEDDFAELMFVITVCTLCFCLGRFSVNPSYSITAYGIAEHARCMQYAAKGR